MKKFIKTLKRQEEGFTLVELMVVVAIIGLLSAVAIPNFKKYQSKAKMSEAKLQLSAIYTAETAFFSDYNIYHNCLNYMGFNPAPEQPSRYYAVGITTTAAIDTTAYGAAANSGLSTAVCTATLAGGDGTTWYRAGKGIGSSIATTATFIEGSALGTQAGTAQMTFTAGAGGIINNDNVAAGSQSALTINHNKIISIIRNGF